MDQARFIKRGSQESNSTIHDESESQIISSPSPQHGQKKRRYRWTGRETRLYLGYIDKWQLILMQSEKKFKQKVYSRMADLIKSRNSQQCKSHHQKMMKRYKTIEKIISNLLRQNGWKQVPKLPEDQLQCEIHFISTKEMETQSSYQESVQNQTESIENLENSLEMQFEEFKQNFEENIFPTNQNNQTGFDIGIYLCL